METSYIITAAEIRKTEMVQSRKFKFLVRKLNGKNMSIRGSSSWYRKSICCCVLPMTVTFFTCFEECITDARKLNIIEISQMRKKIEKMNNEVKLLTSKIRDLKNINEVMG